MNHWRITKYNPEYRDENGRFIAEEWTSAYEIGNVCNGKIVTVDDYLILENNYVNVAIGILKVSGLDGLRVKESSSRTWDNVSALSKLSLSKPSNFKEGSWLGINEIETVLKMMLREAIHCKLVYPRKFYIHIGWDFYMYIGSNIDVIVASKIATANGLFLEEHKSPYL